jgi:hypothetical protein
MSYNILYLYIFRYIYIIDLEFIKTNMYEKIGNPLDVKKTT